MAILARNRFLMSQGFILPVTLISFLIFSTLCLSKMSQFEMNQSALKEKQTITTCFLAFQSAKFELYRLLNATTFNQGTGTLTEGQSDVTYSYQVITPDRFQVDLQQYTPSHSSLIASFIYNRNTKKLEKWVTQ